MIDNLTWLLFESRIALGSLLGFVLFWLLVHWRRSLKPRPLLIGIVVALLLMMVQAVVVTRRETAAAVMDRVEAAIVARRADDLEPLLSAGFRYAELGRPEFVEFVRGHLERLTVHTTGRGTIQAAAGGDERFSVEIPYISRVSVRDFAGQPLPTRWRIEFVREDGEWRIGEIAPLEILNQPVRDPMRLGE